MPEKDEKILKKIRKSRNRGNCSGVVFRRKKKEN